MRSRLSDSLVASSDRLADGIKLSLTLSLPPSNLLALTESPAQPGLRFHIYPAGTVAWPEFFLSSDSLSFSKTFTAPPPPRGKTVSGFRGRGRAFGIFGRRR